MKKAKIYVRRFLDNMSVVERVFEYDPDVPETFAHRFTQLHQGLLAALSGRWTIENGDKEFALCPTLHYVDDTDARVIGNELHKVVMEDMAAKANAPKLVIAGPGSVPSA